MESIQATSDPVDIPRELPPGGIPARNHKGERLLIFLGIIDILQSYRLRKKLEHAFKAMVHDGDTVSVHRPAFYAERFMKFMAEKVFRKIPSSLKNSPSKRNKSIKHKSTSGGGRSGPVSGSSGVGVTIAASGQTQQLPTKSSLSEGGSRPDVVPDRAGSSSTPSAHPHSGGVASAGHHMKDEMDNESAA